MSSSAYTTESTHSVHEVDRYGRTVLHRSARDGDRYKVRALIHELSVNTRDSFGETPLHHAAREGHIEVVEELLQAGSEINAECNDKFTPLHLSVRHGRTDVVSILVRKGARLDVRHKWGRTPLHLALCQCDCVWWDTSNVCICYTYTVMLLILCGASVNIKDNHGLTALHLCADHGWKKTVRMFMNCDCEMDSTDDEGYTPLQVAQTKGHMNVVDILINSGSSVNVKDTDGRTPLHWSSDLGLYETVRMLINRGCKIDPVDDAGHTPLQLAKQNGHLEIVKLLREAKPIQHGDKKLYRLKKTLRMFFGFRRAVEREEGGAVGGRNIQSVGIYPEFVHNTEHYEEFDDVTLPPTSPSSTRATPSQRRSLSRSASFAECGHHLKALGSSMERMVRSESDLFNTSLYNQRPSQCFLGDDESCEGSRHRQSTYNVYYTVHNYYSCNHADQACQQLSSTTSTTRVAGHTPDTPNTSYGGQSVPGTPLFSSSRQPSLKRFTPPTALPQTDTNLLTAVNTTTPQDPPPSPSQTPNTTAPSHGGRTASLLPTTTAQISSPTSFTTPVPTGSESTATSMPVRADPAETLAVCVQQLVRDHESKVDQTGVSHFRSVDNLSNGSASTSFNVIYVHTGETRNVNNPEYCVMNGNINLDNRLKREKTKRDENNDDGSDESSHDSENEQSASDGV